MKKLNDLIARLKDFERAILEIIEEAIRQYEHEVLDLNTEAQLFEKGIDKDGVELASFRPYRPFTVSIKKALGQPTSRVTLRDTEDFHRSFYIEYQADGFEIKASDPKTFELSVKYGDSILGLTDESVLDFAKDRIAPLIIERLKKI